MGVIRSNTYLYVDAALNEFFISGSDVNDRGPWNAAFFYNLKDVVEVNVNLFIAVLPNANSSPSGVIDSFWSSLIVANPSSGSSSGVDQYARDLALDALETAWAGTAIGSLAYQTAIGIAGSFAGTDSFARSQAATALSTGQSAFSIAITGTSIATSAYNIAIAGTNAAASAQSTANSAITNAAAAQSTANSALAVGNAAYLLAQIGTNTGTAAYNLAAAAFALASSGTGGGGNGSSVLEVQVFS